MVGGRSVERSTWSSILRRCYKKDNASYPKWGGRGIRVCKRWRDSFDSFLQDMGRRPSPKHSIDRIDNDGDYKPSNCRWTTNKVQSNNRRNTIWLKYHGQTLSISMWADKLKLPRRLLYGRYLRGCSVKDILDRPARKYAVHRYSYKGKLMTAGQLSKICHLPAGAIGARLSRGWAVSDAIKVPLRGSQPKGKRP